MIPLRDANPVRRVPVVTIGLIVACVVAFAYELGTQSTGGDAALERLFRQFGLVPAELTASFGPGSDRAGGTSGELLAVVTSMFLHGGWLHLIGNMLYLWIFGNNVEDRLGRLPFLLFYLVGGLAAAASQVLIAPDSDIPVVGASGAIAAVLGAYIVLYPRARILSLVFLGFFYQLLEVPALVVLGLWFVLQLIDGLASLGVESSAGGVALFEHIGGFVVGVVIGLVVRSTARRLPPRGLGSPDGVGVG
ncbi:MAG TPA: rhomboid family intramembrane serine protease [Candidatus Limnocylindrales bacterium]|nr:rhomboid family intramembrane serine protease [Candidatus Limnocylindrales bacterium]